jgi:dihydrofolate synthase / folylpolyglutamate synthase
VTDRQSALDFLYQRVNYERLAHVPYSPGTFKLQRMLHLLSRLGNPHLSLNAVHIAGTKGKGSTAALMAAVLQSAGLKTALYTSPHLERLEERFVIDGCCLPEAEFVALVGELRPMVEEMDQEASHGGTGGGLTFFEVTTALGFLYFARHKVDIAILEVGLGGRLDSTNVCQPEVSIITSISYDHTKQLGETLGEIAWEKAGIIKPGVPVISGVMNEEPRLVIERVARKQAALLSQRGIDFDTSSTDTDKNGVQAFDYRQGGELPELRLENLEIQLPGAHQRANAAVAIAALQQLASRGWDIPEAALRRGLAAARCRARVQILRERPPLVLDVAHNVASVQALVDTLQQRFPKTRPTLIFATSRDKDVEGMLEILIPFCQALILTRYISNPRAIETAELLSIAERVSARLPPAAVPPKLIVASTPEAAWHQACALENELICITGSFFLAADMTEVLRKALPGLQI